MAKLIKGVNDLATLYPDLVKEWNFEKNDIKPDEITCGTNRKVWWTCSRCNNIYATRVTTKLRGRGNGCSECKKKKLNNLLSTPKTYEDSLEYQYPELMKEWDYKKNDVKPSEIFPKSGIKVWWKCKNNHSWDAIIYNRTKGQGCPYCSGKRIIVGQTDLATKYPNLLLEWDIEKNTAKPTEILPNYNKKVFWKCKKGHSWDATPNSRISGNNCPYCSNQKVLKGYNDFATTHKYLLKYWNFEKNAIKPTEITSGSGKEVWWVCEKGHSWQAKVFTKVRSNGSSCPICNLLNKQSRTEQLVHELLIGNKYIREWKQQIGVNNRRYDFFVLSNKVVIEIDGQQHFIKCENFTRQLKQEIEVDTQKNNHLLKLGIPLLRLPGLDMFKRGTSLTEDDYLWYLHQHINYFLETRKIPKDIIQFYKENSENNYAEVAKKMNELVETGQI